MVVLYVVSTEEATGKTTVCAGLSRHLQDNGKKVGYLRLVAAGESGAESDATFMKKLLEMPEGIETVCLPAGDAAKIKHSCDAITAGRDAIIIEGRLGDGAGKIAREIGAKVIVINAYSGQVPGSVEDSQEFGENLMGVIINKVPSNRLKAVRQEAEAQLGSGTKVLGVIPEDRVLLALTVGELAEAIGGEILNNGEKSSDLVESLMLGALVVDSGLDYFGRKNAKAAVIRQERPDMQMAALETSTKCLVLSGSLEKPVYSVMEKAENRGIPIIATGTGTADIVAGIEAAIKKARFGQEKKLSKLADILKQHVDLQTVA